MCDVKAASAIIFFVIFVSLCSCASPHLTISKDFDIPEKQIDQKIPFRVGLYFTPGFKSYRQVLYPYNGDFFAGDAFCSGSERILRGIFKDVILLDLPNTTQQSNVDIVINPEVIRLDNVQHSNEKEFIFHVDFRWNILSPDGKIIYTNLIKAELVEPAGQVIYFGFESPTKRSENFMQFYMIAIRNQFQKAQNDIYSTSWWKDPWWTKKK